MKNFKWKLFPLMALLLMFDISAVAQTQLYTVNFDKTSIEKIGRAHV